MRLSADEISSIAEGRGFATEPVERMIRLFDVLDTFSGDEVMGPRMALVGGTALNAFHADLPRLSLDIDIHYMGEGGSVRIDKERPVFEDRALRIMEDKGYSLLRNPRSDTSGRWVFGYADMQGLDAQLHIDVNYAQQPSFFGTRRLSSAPLGNHRARDVPVGDKSEVVGGKLAALVSRERARDLFDARVIADMPDLDWRRAKLAAVALGAADRRLDWRELSPASIKGNVADLQESLEICLPAGYLDAFGGRQAWLDDTVSTCRTALAPMFRLTEGERAFLGAVLDHGEVDANHLDVDDNTRRAIEARPTLQTRAQLVRDMRHQERVAEERERQRPDIALRLASALTERISPTGQAHWGNLRQGIEKRLEVAERRQDVSQNAINDRAKDIARKRAEADLRVQATQDVKGEMIHEFEARFAGNPRMPLKQQAPYDDAVREGMQRLAGEDIPPVPLEIAAARLEVASEGTAGANFARDVAKALEFGTVFEAEKIREERAVLPFDLEKGMEGFLESEKARLMQRLYRSFTVIELHGISLGKSPHLDTLPDADARARASRTLDSLLAVNIPAPVPWNALNEGLAKSRGIERDNSGASKSASY